jgi:hypothetical protein
MTKMGDKKDNDALLFLKNKSLYKPPKPVVFDTHDYLKDLDIYKSVYKPPKPVVFDTHDYLKDLDIYKSVYKPPKPVVFDTHDYLKDLDIYKSVYKPPKPMAFDTDVFLNKWSAGYEKINAHRGTSILDGSFSRNSILGVCETAGEIALSSLVNKVAKNLISLPTNFSEGLAGALIGIPATIAAKALCTVLPDSPKWEFFSRVVTAPIVLVTAGPIGALAYLGWGLIRYIIKRNI